MRNGAFAVTLAAAVALGGCIAVDEVEGRRLSLPDYDGIFKCDSSDVSTLDDGHEEVAHEGPWSWEDLAVRAGKRSDASKVAYIDAAVRRLRAEEELTWKDPELRFGQGWGDSRSRASGDPQANGGDYSTSVGVRFYVPNPFVERYIRAKRDGEIRKEDARAAVEAYEVYSEVKMLCYEEARARADERYLEERAKAWDDLRKASDESYRNGVFISPLDAIRAETKFQKAKIKLDTMVSARETLRRRIAWLTGIPDDRLVIDSEPPPMPDPASLSVEHLTEIAFARRPDLAAAVAELDEAEAGVKAAKAARIPWFRFVEATYSHDNDRMSEWDRHKTGHSDEFSVKASIYLPIFTWAGESVELSEMVQARANARLMALYSSIRQEITTAYNDYFDACSRVKEKESRQFVERMEKRIREYSSCSAAMAEETCKANEELIDYKNVQDIARMLRVEAALRLEAVVGGPLPLPADYAKIQD